MQNFSCENKFHLQENKKNHFQLEQLGKGLFNLSPGERAYPAGSSGLNFNATHLVIGQLSTNRRRIHDIFSSRYRGICGSTFLSVWIMLTAKIVSLENKKIHKGFFL